MYSVLAGNCCVTAAKLLVARKTSPATQTHTLVLLIKLAVSVQKGLNILSKRSDSAGIKTAVIKACNTLVPSCRKQTNKLTVACNSELFETTQPVSHLRCASCPGL